MKAFSAFCSISRSLFFEKMTTKKFQRGLFLAFVAIALFNGQTYSQTTGDYQSNAALFNWTATASWQRWNGTTWVSNPTEGYPGQNGSGIAGTVTILNGHTVTLDANPAPSIGNLAIGGGTSGTLILGNSTTSRTINLSGGVTLAAGSTLTVNNPGSAVSHNFSLAGNFTNNGGTFTPVNGNGRVVVNFFSSANQTINGTLATQTFDNVTVNKTGGTLDVTGSTTAINVASLSLNSAASFTAPATVTASASIILASGTTYTAGAITNVGGNFTNNGSTFVPGTGSNTVIFNGSGAQAINGTAVTQTFNNVTVNKATNTLSVGGSTTTLNVANLTRTLGNFTAPATVNVSGNVLLTLGTYTAGANTNIGGDFTNNGGTFTPGPGANTVTFNGTSAQEINGTVATQTFNNIVVNKASGALSVGGSTTTVVANGSVTLTAGTFNAPPNLNVGGANFTNNGGTFAPGSGTITFTGGSNQSINGSATTQTFNNFAVNKSGNTLSFGGSTTTLNVANLTRQAGTFTAPATVNVSGNVLLTAGTYTAGANTNIGGDFTNNGGTFTPGAGNTVTFNGAGAQAINGTLTPQAFTNLVIDKPSGVLSVTGAITLNVAGNWTNNNSTFTPGSSTVTFNGTTGPQQINGTAVTQTFNNVTVNKSGTTPITLSVSGSTTTINVAAFTLTAGNFTAPATLNATGALTLTNGTYTAGTNTNLESNFTRNGGTFTVGTNTVTFTGSGAKIIAGSSAATATFYDLIVNSGSVFFGNNTTSRTINITNNFTINGGSFLSGATGTTGTHTINLTGNLINNGALDLTDNGATTHRIIFTGAGAKTVSGSGTTLLRNVRMSTTGSANVNVNSNVQINGLLDWTLDGLLVLGAANLTFGSTATMIVSPTAGSPSTTRYIQSDGSSALTGQVIRVNDNNTATWKFLFPIGTATGGYSPLDLTNAATVITNAPTLNSTLAAKAILSADAPGRLKRTFRMTVAGNFEATTFTNGRFSYFNPGDVSGSESMATYNTIWYQRESTGVWTSVVGTAPGANIFIGSTVAQPLTNDTYYFTIGTPSAFGQTWYSYQTGNWSNPLSWTTDGSSFPLYVNPTNAIPGVADNVVITSGKTISLDVSTQQVVSMNVIGTLDVLATTGHNFGTISGSGRIRIAGATDNFPAGTATNFADNAVGGTLEINGTSILLSTPRTFNNVVINMSATANAAVLKSNYTINGDLTITQGLLQFEDATAPANRTVVVNGHVTVGVNGGIRTHNSSNRHEFNLFGDFINDGVSYFTNRTAADYNNEAADGIVDANFRSAARNQQITCNGETRFYRIEIDKGTDDTYIASISASSVANFNLFGRANDPVDNDTDANDNALALLAGTVELGDNVTVLLNNTNSYSIRAAAQLWINGATVTKTGNAIVPYGTVRISAGSLTVLTNGGLTLRDSGVILVEGGTATLGTIRTSTNGANAVGSYIQSGGAVTIVGPEQTSYSMFSLTYPSNVFNMSGGTLTVQNRSSLGTRGAIFINSNPANVSVTGGTVIMEANNANVYRITSRASFWNVIMRATGGTRAVQLLGTTSGTGTVGVDELTLAIQPLIVLNDFTVEGNVTFTTNSADVTVGGNFEIQNGAIYTHGTNTTTINGAGVSSLIFGNTAITQTFNNLTINKTNATDEVVITAGRPGPTNAALQVNGTLSVAKGIFDYGTFVASARGTVTLSSGVIVGKSTSTGRLLLNGASAQTINSSIATVYNLELNNSNNVTLGTNNLTILGTLTMTAGIFDINIFRLTIGAASSPAANISGTGFSASKMIRLAGNASDEGLELYLDANETLTYPIGTNAGGTPRYTPVTAVFQNFVDDGFVRMSLGDAELPTSNIAAGANTIISYYWRVQHSGFTTLPRVTSYTFNAQDSDDADAGATPGGLVAGFVPGKVLDVTPFTRSSEVVGNISAFAITLNGNTGSGATPFTLETANYTAGTGTRFTGLPTIYYSRSNGATGFPGLDWHNGNSWSLVSHTGAAAGSFPTAGSIAIIGSGDTGANNYHSINVTGANAVAAELIFAPVPSGTFQGRLTVQENRNVTFGRVSGPGTVMIRVNTTQQPVVVGDFGDFSLETTSQYNYTSEQDAVTPISLPTNPVVFPNLRFEGAGGGGGTERRMTIPADILVRRNINVDQSANFVLGGNVTVQNDVLISDGSSTQGRVEFPSTGSNLTFSIARDLFLRTGAGTTTNFVVGNGTPSSLQHRLIVGRNITIASGNLDLFNGTGTNNNAILEIGGTVNGTYTNTASTTPDLFRLVMNKGTSTATSFTLSNNMTLNGPFDQATKPLELQNGLLVLNNASIDYTLTSGGGDFNIPSSAGLEVRAGAARTTTTSTNANITLDGLLRISGGTVDVNGGGTTDTNYIEYSNTGNATIEVTSGSLTVAGQIRRSLISATGVLKYTQSGGTVLVGNEAAPSTTRGVFEVLNPGSQFNHSGGSFTIVRGNGSASVASLWLEPGSATITSGSTITIGNASTPAGTIGIQSSVALNNLAIAGSAASTPQVSLYVTPLTVDGNVTVAASNTLNALGRDLTIGGNFTVNGTYISGTNTTIFNNPGTATIGGALSALSFNNFTKTGAGTLSLARDITINRDLKASAGILNTATFAINLLRHAEVDATITSTSGSGLIFGSTVTQQQLTRSLAGTGELGIVTINNPNGVIVPDGNGYDFSIATNLRMQSGIFDIGGSLLTLETSALITPVNPYSATNLIQTNSSFTDKGVRKQFPINYTTDFIFPVGQSNYTPVTFTFSGGNTTGSSGTPTITVRPSNRRHPVIINDDGVGELPDPVTFNDLNNVLQYYWIIGASGIASDFKSNMALQYTQPLVSVVNPYTESDYIAARILTDLSVNPLLNISKFSTAEVNEATNVINFSFATVTDERNITGDYFAGIPVAIPDNVTTYTTVTSGDVNDAVYDQTVFGGVPNGARVIVSPGHTLNFNVNSVILYQTIINAGAKVVIPDGSIGHSLGVLSGTGDLEINSNSSSAVLPAALYDNFLSCTGGGLIFGGSGNYEILGGITAVRNLTLNGSGSKVMANNDLTVCNDFTINSGAFFNSTNQNIIVQNDVLLNGGAYNNAGGTLSISRDLVQTSGAFSGGTAGTKLIGRNLTVNSGTFSPGSGTSNITRVNGDMTVAGAATISTGTGGATGQRFTFAGTSAQLLTGTFTGSRAFNRLEVNNSTGLTIAGNTTINSELLLTSGLITPSSSSVVILLESSSISTPSAGSATSFVNGKLYKVLANTQSFTFPIGKGTRWRSGSVNSVFQSGLVTWDMEYFAAAATGAVAAAPAPRSNPVDNFTSADASVLRMSGGEHWRVSDGSATSNGRTAIVGLSWGIESDVSTNLAQREAMKVMSWNGTNWTNNGGTNFQPGGSHTQTRGTFESTSALSFSENIVILGSTEVANALPVTLVRFEGKLNGSVAMLNWTTASELNNDYFEVQRSTDGFEFVALGKVAGKGTTNSTSDYFYEDENLVKGNNYYRLKQVDYDGKSSYSNVVVINYDGATPLGISLYPNPTTSQNVNLKLINSTGEDVNIRIYDLAGKTQFKSTATSENLSSEMELKTDELKAGIYLVEVVQGTQRIVKRLFIKE